MAKYNRINEPVIKAKNFIDRGIKIDKSMESTLKTYNKERISRKLYNDGFAWYKKNMRLEDANDKIIVDGHEVKINETIYFQRGYQAGAMQVGYEYGKKNIPLENIEKKYLDDKYFLNGYKNGLEDTKDNKKHKSK